MANILIIDDDSDIIQLFKILLSGKGYSVKAAINSKEAEKLLSETNFDVIFVDIILPGRMGNKFAKEVKSIYRESAVILMSATFRGLQAQRELLKETEADDFISKPFTEEAIVQIVNKFLSKEINKKTIKIKNELIPVIVLDEDIEEIIMSGTFVASNFNIIIIDKLFELKEFLEKYGYGILILDYNKSPSNILKLVSALSKNYPNFYIILSVKDVHLKKNILGVNYIIHKPVQSYEMSKLLKSWEGNFDIV